MDRSPFPLTPPPHPKSDRLQKSIKKCVIFDSSWDGEAYRATAVKWANLRDLMSGEGSRRWGGRWNPPGIFRTVYLSLDLDTAEHEYFAQNRRNGLPDSEGLPFVKSGAVVRLSRTLDLTSADVRKRLGVMKREIVSGSHDPGPESLTQAVGRIAHSECYQGLIVPSAAAPRRSNIVIFPDKLEPDQLMPVHPEDLPPRIAAP